MKIVNNYFNIKGLNGFLEDFHLAHEDVEIPKTWKTCEDSWLKPYGFDTLILKVFFN
jgi:hypothetical protein